MHCILCTYTIGSIRCTVIQLLINLTKSHIRTISILKKNLLKDQLFLIILNNQSIINIF